jgi:hypothetical protein
MTRSGEHEGSARIFASFPNASKLAVLNFRGWSIFPLSSRMRCLKLAAAGGNFIDLHFREVAAIRPGCHCVNLDFGVHRSIGSDDCGRVVGNSSITWKNSPSTAPKG